MSRWVPRRLAITPLIGLILVAATPAQERTDRGLRLRMSDRLESAVPAAGPAPSGPVTGAEPAAAPGAADAWPLRGLSFRLTSGIRFEDNVYRSDTHERRDAVVVMRPKVLLSGRLGRHDLRLGYEGDVARYQRESRENYFNHRFLSAADLDLSRILKSSLHAELAFESDPRGDLTTRPFADTRSGSDRWRRHAIGGSVTLGRRIARAQIGLAYEVAGVRYLNNAQQERDFDERSLDLTARYNLGPRLSLLAETRGAWIDYLSPRATLDAREYRALVGVGWEATAKTRGEVKVGLRHRDFHAISRPSLNGYTWDARVNWSPRTYSQLTAYTSREVTDSGFGGGLGTGTAVVDVFGLRWRHGFTDRLTLDAGVERNVAAFEEGGDDRFMRYETGLRYRLSRRLDLFGQWTLDTRSGAGGSYEAGGVFLGFDLRFDRPLGR